MSLEVTRKGIVSILDILKKGEWQIPQFQREFIWNQEQVKKLIYSFIKSYPIGLITIWDQPQNNPYTPGEPLTLRGGSQFRDYTNDPAVIKLVLDGKQRLTTLAMIFGGFRAQNAQFSYSGGWFVDIDAVAKGDEANAILYKKKSEISHEDLSTLATSVRKAKIPFKDFYKLGEYLQNINNPDIYPEGQYPDKDVRESRTRVLNSLLNNFNQFQIPIAEIPSTVDLGDVCEIFDVLNTTGTKVSTFDLIHNKLFKESNGSFLLRDKFNSYKDLASFVLLCDDNRQEFLCQTVTGCYLLEDNPIKSNKSNETISSIKGRDLIETPLGFYSEFDRNSPKMDSYTSDLFSNILNSDFKISEIPYPVQIVIYLSLRWHLEFRLKADYYNQDELNKIFKAFFWRNTLTSRYDQGFLTQFSSDLKKINQILIDLVPKRGAGWNNEINEKLNEMFGAQYKVKTKQELIDLVKDDELRGALRQGISLLIYANTKLDLVSGEKLNRFSEERGRKVQLHHIFPKDWCRNNRGKYPIVNILSEDNLANLIPLISTSNNAWRANSPSTAIQQLNLAFDGNRNRYEGGFINIDAFNFLRTDDVENFWNLRADRIAEELYNLQFVA